MEERGEARREKEMKENEVELVFIGYLARHVKFESVKLKKKYQEVKYRGLLILDAPRNNEESESKEEVIVTNGV